jgi:DNA-3-methyladenine glycosylase II
MPLKYPISDHISALAHRQTRLGHIVVEATVSDGEASITHIELPPKSNEFTLFPSTHLRSETPTPALRGEGAEYAEASAHDLAEQVAEQVAAFIAGTRKSVGAPLHTPFASSPVEAVWDVIAEIPYGHIRTYERIAHEAGLADEGIPAGRGALLAVSRAVGLCPFSIALPVHRAVGSLQSARPAGATGEAARIRAFLRTLEQVVLQRDARTPEGIASLEGTATDATGTPCFPYDGVEVAYLSATDPHLARCITKRGLIYRPSNPDLFSGLIETIVSQQVSSRAADTVITRLYAKFDGAPSSSALAQMPEEDIQQLGMTYRKAGYLISAARAVEDGRLDAGRLSTYSDEEIVRHLVMLPGLGRWSAEMLMLFSLQRNDILAWDDLAIRRGMMTVYGLSSLSRKRFDARRESLHPCGSVASLYFWAAS